MPHDWTTQIAVFALVPATLVGCRDATRPPATPEEPPAAVEFAPATVAGVQATLDDVTLRILPALDDQVAAGRLRGLLATLSGHLAGADAAGARDAAAQARAVLDDLAGRPEAAAWLADLDAIRLALDYAESVLAPRVEEIPGRAEEIRP